MNLSLAAYRPVRVPLKRLGRNGDGGYVVPQAAVDGAKTLISLGLGDDLSFDHHFAKDVGGRHIFALDGTVSFPSFLLSIISTPVRTQYNLAIRRRPDRALALLRKSGKQMKALFLFFRLFVLGNNTFVNRNIGSRTSVKSLSLQEVIAQASSQDLKEPLPDLFLKMDVEGDEFQVVPDICHHAYRFTGLVIEWHDIGMRWDEFEAAMSELLAEFAVTHVHGNNHRPLVPGSTVPSVLEISMVSRRLLPDCIEYHQCDYPLEHLDFPNDPTNPELPIYFS